MLAPAPTAESIMSRDVKAVRDTWTLREASVFLEELDRTGAPVVDAAGNVCGFLSLRDIMKGRRSGQMHAPVRSYMTRSVFTASPSSTLREIETAFFQHTIFYLPVVEDRRLVGIVTRSAYLAARAGEPEAGAAAAAAQPAAEPARSGPEIRPGGNSDPRRG
jgi:tRNA nucleotidyltransferase (CCA-adding enzyme)